MLPRFATKGFVRLKMAYSRKSLKPDPHRRGGRRRPRPLLRRADRPTSDRRAVDGRFGCSTGVLPPKTGKWRCLSCVRPGRRRRAGRARCPGRHSDDAPADGPAPDRCRCGRGPRSRSEARRPPRVRHPHEIDVLARQAALSHFRPLEQTSHADATLATSLRALS